MKSMAMGTGMARMRSAMNTTAPLSTPTSSGTRPACSRATARPSSPTRAAISSREMSTRPRPWGMQWPVRERGLPGSDERGQGALAAHPLGHALGVDLALEGPDADAVVGLAVAGSGRRDVRVEARLLELFLEGVRLRLRLERRDLHRPEAGRVRLRPRRCDLRGLRLLDYGLAAAHVRIRWWRRLGARGLRDGVRLGLVLGALRRIG